MTLIIIGAILIFVVSMIWMWHNLGNIEKPRKIAFMIIGLLIMYGFTVVLYTISSSNIAYPSEEIQKTVSNTLILVFTGLNALIFLPFIANLFDNILEEEIEKNIKGTILIKSKFKNKSPKGLTTAASLLKITPQIAPIITPPSKRIVFL